MAKKGKATKKAKTSDSAPQSTTTTTATTTKLTRKKIGPFLGEELLLPASKVLGEKIRVKEIHPGCVWVVYDFLKPKECQAWIDFVENSKELEICGHPASKYVAHRECYRWQRNDTHIAQTIFERMEKSGIIRELQAKIEFSCQSYLPRGCNPNIRFYKYETGMRFGKHVDESHPVEGAGNTEVTVLVYLSECKGGATRFYADTSTKKKSFAFAPKVGALLLHVHGNRCLEHEGDPVEGGIKYILRSDIVYASS